MIASIIKTSCFAFDWIGLTSQTHLPYELDRPEGHPGLYELAMAGLSILKKSPNGFFLFIEGARIDQAHHENRAMLVFLLILRKTN